MKKQTLFILIIIGFYFSIALYKIDSLPGEWYGDISNVHEYVGQILKGEWPFYFFQSPGPLYHYAIAPIILLLNSTTYLAYKIASVLIGFISLISIYLLARELGSNRLALVTSVVTAVSFWFIVVGRLGNSQVIIPAITSLMVYYLVLYSKYEHWRYLFIGVVVSSLGLFTYPQTFILPIVFMLIMIFDYYTKRKLKVYLSRILVAAAAFIPAILLFLSIVIRQPDNFIHGYIGKKIFQVGNYSTQELILKTIKNAFRTALVLHIEGDNGFRGNVSKSPHLDTISGLFFLLGLIFWIKKRRRKYLHFILIPLFLFPIPSLSPAIPIAEIPNSGRVINILPLVYILVASGILSTYNYLNRLRNLSANIIIYLVFILSVFLNLKKYFIQYPKGLPNQNTPFGRIIADEINKMPSDTLVFINGCCWGEWGQPEPKGIWAEIKGNYDIKFFKAHDNPKGFLCDDIETNYSKKEYIFFVNPNFIHEQNKIRRCKPSGNKKVIKKKGYDVVWMYYYKD